MEQHDDTRRFAALRPRLFSVAYRMLGIRADAEDAAELASELSVAMMWVLERLAPEERAAFLLRQAFDQDYGELAAVLGKSEAACRQLVHRASERVRREKPRSRACWPTMSPSWPMAAARWLPS